MTFPIEINQMPEEASGPETCLGEVCGHELTIITKALEAGVNVLVTADAETVRHFVNLVVDRCRLDGHYRQEGSLLELPPPGFPGMEESLRMSVHGELLRLFRDDGLGRGGAPLVVWHSLEVLFALLNGQINPLLGHEAAFLINGLLDRTVWLAFQDPCGPPVPASLAGVFPTKVRLPGVSAEILPLLMSREEAAKISQPGSGALTFEDARDVSECVREINPLYFRRLIRYATTFESNREDVLKRLREAAMRTSHMEAPPEKVDFWGYEKLVGETSDLCELVIRPYLRWKNTRGAERAEIGRHIFKTIILHGEPGTGKTLLAKWLASQMGVRYRVVYPSDVKASLLGASEANVRRIFDEARLNAASMLIFDEMDALFKTRASGGGAASVETGIASTLLSEMAGFSEDTMVFVVGATNRREDIDPAFLRPGRGGLQIKVNPPDEESVIGILCNYIKKLGIADLLSDGAEALAWAVAAIEIYPKDEKTSDEDENTSDEDEKTSDEDEKIPVVGDHLYGLCRRILLRGRKVDTKSALKDLVDLVRKSHVERKEKCL